MVVFACDPVVEVRGCMVLLSGQSWKGLRQHDFCRNRRGLLDWPLRLRVVGFIAWRKHEGSAEQNSTISSLVL